MIIEIVNTVSQAKALKRLGEAIRFASGSKWENIFIDAVERRGSLVNIDDCFYRLLCRGQTAGPEPSDKGKRLVRIKSEADCRAVAKKGHCFDDLDMIQAVLSAEC